MNTFAKEDSISKKIYLLSGLGSDYRVFQKINIENKDYDTVYVHFIRPLKNETLPEYAQRLSTQIDTTQPFSLVGVSLGGMIVVEMSKFLNPEEIIIIASAKTKHELPKTYRFFRKFPLHGLFSGRFYIWLIRKLQERGEPASKVNLPLYKSMLKGKDPKFMKRAINFLIKWDNEVVNPKIIHIHGTKDNTLPYRYINKPTITIVDGSHLITYTKGEEVSKWLNFYIK